MIYGHGDDSYNYKVELKADFSSNVRYDGCPQLLIEYLAKNIHTIQNYPEPDGKTLTNLIAQKEGLDSDQVLIFNGSTDAFYRVAQLFMGKKSAIQIPSFAEYEDACRLYSHELLFIQKEDLLSASLPKADLVWIGNPNNPDGFSLTPEQICKLLKTYPEHNFFIDEAYQKLSLNTKSVIHLVSSYSNLIVCRSLTKAYGIPGLRLGYLAGSKEVIQSLSKYIQPWSVNTLALKAGEFILNNEDKLKPDLLGMQKLTSDLSAKINQIPLFNVIPGNTFFFLVRMKQGNAASLKKYLLEKHGLLIRDCSNFRGLGIHYFRIGIQSAEKNSLLVEALKEYDKIQGR